MSANSTSVLAHFQRYTIQYIKFSTTRKQPVTIQFSVLKTQIKFKDFLIGWQMSLGCFNILVITVNAAAARGLSFAHWAYRKHFNFSRTLPFFPLSLSLPPFLPSGLPCFLPYFFFCCGFYFCWPLQNRQETVYIVNCFALLLPFCQVCLSSNQKY